MTTLNDVAARQRLTRTSRAGWLGISLSGLGRLEEAFEAIYGVTSDIANEGDIPPIAGASDDALHLGAAIDRLTMALLYIEQQRQIT